MTRVPAKAFAVLLGAASLLIPASCGGGGDDDAGDDGVASLEGSSPTTDSDETTDSSLAQEDFQQAMLDYAQCMRDEGIDMPDPQFSDGGGGEVAVAAQGSPTERPDEAAMEAADAVCKPILDAVEGSFTPDPEEEAAMREEALEFAQCMRDHGIDFPDPVFEDGGRVMVGGGEDETFDPNDPAFQAAQEECAGDDGMFGGPVISKTDEP